MTIKASTQTQALILLFKTMPEQTQKEFVEWIEEHPKAWEHSTEEEDSQFWMSVSSDAFGETWGDPAEDIWDEIYQKDMENEKLQAV